VHCIESGNKLLISRIYNFLRRKKNTDQNITVTICGYY